MVPGSELLDISGPWEVFGHANDVLGWPAYQLVLAGPASPTVPTRHGLLVTGVEHLPARTKRLPDLAIVAGGSPAEVPPPAEGALAAWLRRHHERIPALVSICTGAFILGQAGLLDNHRVTTHWLFLSALRSRFPAARVIDDGIFIRDGRLWTSAGISAGIDLTLALVEEDHGRSVAMAVARKLVLFLRRSGNQAQFSGALQRQGLEPGPLRGLIAYVQEHIDEPLPVQRLSRAIGVSPRSLARACRSQLGESPAALVRRLRIDEARRLLESTSLPLKDIALRTGLGDPSTLWRAFTQLLAITPAEYRQRFAP